jgi:hypothetical protein
MKTVDKLTPGTRVRIEQRIDRREGNRTADIAGEVIEVLTAPTGSWFAHGDSERYLLKRVKLRKDNGEVTVVSLDEDTRITVLEKTQLP